MNTGELTVPTENSKEQEGTGEEPTANPPAFVPEVIPTPPAANTGLPFNPESYVKSIQTTAQTGIPDPNEPSPMEKDIQDLALSLVNRPAEQVKGFLAAGKAFNADDYAKALSLAASWGVAPSAVYGNSKAFENPIDPQTLVNVSPKLAAWLVANSDNASIAHDDLEALQKLEIATRSKYPQASQAQIQAIAQDLLATQKLNQERSEGKTFLNATTASLAGIPGFFGSRVLAPLVGAGEAAFNSAGNLLWNYNGGGLGLAWDRIKKEWVNMGVPDTLADQTRKLFADDIARMTSDSKQGVSREILVDGKMVPNPEWQTFIPDAGNAIQRFAARQGNEIFNRETGNAIYSVPGEMAKFGFGGALAVNTTIASAATNSWEQARQEMQAKHPNVPLTKGEEATALSEGMYTGFLNYLLMNKVPHTGPASSMIGTVAKEGAKQTGLAAAMTAGENFVARLHDPDRDLSQRFWENWATFQGFGLAGIVPQLAQVRQNNAVLGAIAKDNKLKSRAPDKNAELVNLMVDGTGKENVFVDADLFYQSARDKGLDPKALLDQMGAKNITGYDLAIPTGQYANLMKDQPSLHEVLAPDLKFSLEQLTPHEAERQVAELESQSTQSVKTMMDLRKEVTGETSEKPEFKRIFEEIKGRYVVAGDTPAVAATFALDQTKIVSRFAERSGLTPDEVFRQFWPSVVRGEAPKPQDIIHEAIPEENFPAEGVYYREGDNLMHIASPGVAPVVVDPYADKIFYQSGLPIFYSALQKAIPEIAKIADKEGMIAADQAKAWIAARQKEGKFKAAELDAIGLPEFIDTLSGSDRKQKIPFESIQNFVENNGIKINELTKGEMWYFLDTSGTGQYFDTKEEAQKAFDKEVDWIYEESTQLMDDSDNEDNPAIMVANYDNTTLFEAYPNEDGEWIKYENGEEKVLGSYNEAISEAENVIDDYEKYWRNEMSSEVSLADSRRMDNAQYSDYKVPGGEGYKELLLMLTNNGKLAYKSSHWKENNVLAHVRFDERTDNDGKKVLFIQEIQSDWAQKGRKEGFDNEKQFDELVKKRDAAPEGSRERQDLQDRLNAFSLKSKGVPEAPFVTDTKAWVGLTIKRMLRYASENGFDKIAFATGQQNADIYDLSSRVDKVYYRKNENGTYDLRALDNNQSEIEIAKDLHEKSIPDYVGNEIAAKIINGEGAGTTNEFRYLQGVDLQVGGEGMKAFYDQIIPQVAKDVIKRLGGSIGKTELDIEGGKSVQPSIDITHELSNEVQKGLPLFQSQKNDFSFGSKAWQDYYRDKIGGNARAAGDQALRARKANRRAAGPAGQKELDGLRAEDSQAEEARAKAEEEAFQRFNVAVDRVANPRGWFTRNPDGTYTIGKSPNGDFSTWIHEPAHAFLETFANLAGRDTASEQLKTDFGKVLDYLGVESWDKVGTPEHEKWARASETYAREGKAPSLELRLIFQRFKVWLQSIYRHVSEMEPINDDIRGVFDRMRASDAEIEAAKERLDGNEPLFKSAEQAGMTPEQFKAYQESHARGEARAPEELQHLLNQDAKREQLAWWRDELNKVKDEVAKQVDAEPVQIAFKALTEGDPATGEKIKLSKQALIDQFGEGALKDLPRHGAKWVYDAKGGGLDADGAAELFGFNDGHALIEALKTMEPRKARIDADAELIMKQKHGDIMTDGSLADAAVKSLMGAEREKRLHKELERLRKLQSDAIENKTAAKAVLASIPPIQAFRNSAKSMASSMNLRDLKPYNYLVASRQASKVAREAYAKDDFKAAGDATQKELLNQHLYLEAKKVQAEGEKIDAYGLKSQTPKFQGMLGKAGLDYQEQFNALAGQYEFQRLSNRELDAIQTLGAWATEKASEGEPIVIDPMLFKQNKIKNWREVPITELRAVYDGLRNIETVARKQLGETLDGKKLEFDIQADRLNQVARESNQSQMVTRQSAEMTRMEKFKHGVLGRLAEMQRSAWWILRLDGGDVLGPAYENIMGPIDKGTGKEKALGDQIKKGLIEIFSDMTPKEHRRERDSIGVTLPLFDRSLNRKEAFSLLLNLGSAENRNVAFFGEHLVNEDGSLIPEVDQILGKFTAKELRRAQKIWDLMEVLAPMIQDKYRRDTGTDLKMKERTPFQVRSVDGEDVQLQGGYIPLKSDANISNVGRKQEGPVVIGGFNYKPLVSTGHTMEVTGATYPLLLDYPTVLGSHLQKVIRNLTMGDELTYVNKFLNREDVRKTISETIGIEKLKGLDEWLKDVASSGIDNTDNSYMARMLLSLRSGMVMARLAGNITSYLVQFGDSFKLLPTQSAAYLSKYLPEAHLDLKLGRTSMEEIRRLSPNEMRFREENAIRESRDLMESKTLYDAGKKSVAEYLFSWYKVMDRTQTFPAWLAKFREGMDTHHNEERAIAEADNLIKTHFQTGDPHNMSKMMRSKGFTRFFTTFGGDNNTWFGILSNAIEGKDIRAASVCVMALILEQMFAAMIRGKTPNAETAKNWTIDQTTQAIFNPFGPYGNFADYAYQKATGQHATLSNPTLDAFSKALDFPANVHKYNEGTRESVDLTVDAIESLGLLSGTPFTGQVVKSLRYQRGLATGKIEPPANKAEEIARTLLGGPYNPKGE